MGLGLAIGIGWGKGYCLGFRVRVTVRDRESGVICISRERTYLLVNLSYFFKKNPRR